MDLNALIVFAKVVEAKSFSEAARRLGMPVSTVSRRVAELEDQLGVRLLDRSTRNLRLTDLGSEVLEHAQRSAEASEAVQNVVSNRQSSVLGTLRLSAPPNISDTLLGPLVTAFQASYPNVRVQILIAERYVDHIADGVDIAFRLGAVKDQVHTFGVLRPSCVVVAERAVDRDICNERRAGCPELNADRAAKAVADERDIGRVYHRVLDERIEPRLGPRTHQRAVLGVDCGLRLHFRDVFRQHALTITKFHSSPAPACPTKASASRE